VSEAADQLRALRAELVADLALDGPGLRAALVTATDAWLKEVLGNEYDVALVAVGGYGRRDPAPYSDLDLVLLHRSRADVAAVADRLWYPIWDAGVGLDHSVRTPAEALRVARDDLKATLGLLDARLVAGQAELLDEVTGPLRAAWRADARRRLPELGAATRERWATAGEAAFLLEPDLKEARGGLRDVTFVRAVAAAWVGDIPGEGARQAAERLLDVRGVLHRRAGRNLDRLLLQEQTGVAADLGLADADALAMQVSSAARLLSYAADTSLRRVDELSITRRGRLGRSREPAREPLAEGVVAQGREVVLARNADPAADPVLVLRAAAAAAQAGLALAPHALVRLASDSPPLPEPWPREALDALVALLGAGDGTVPVVEALDHAGLWEGLLPPWSHVRSRPQRNAVHRFTVDRHLLETAVAAAAHTRDVGRPDLLLLGALLHDIGKGLPGDHSTAGEVVVRELCPRLGLEPHEVEVVAALTRHHLLLPDTATRRDLDDPATARAVADAVGSREVLELLHALTIADAAATGPAAWSEWKAGLVADLVARAAAVLAGAPAPEPTRLRPEQLALAGAGEFAVLVQESEVTVVAPDRPGLLSRTAGVLALHRLDVRGASASSVGDMAVTVLEAHPRFGSPPDWAVVRADLRRAFEAPEWLAHRLSARERDYPAGRTVVVPPRVLLVDDASESATVLEVRAHDRLGLLHAITRAIAASGLDVRAARVSTLGAEAVDAFYVVGPDGAKLTDPALRESVVAAVLAAASA
jgi:[protein-PII] uridylyltransferase